MSQKDFISETARFLQEEIVLVRRDLHMMPELSFKEHNTASFAYDTLTNLGYQARAGIAKTGVLADLGQGPKIAIRADMDALPVNENNELAYKSKVKNVMHACGHDAHVAIALASAKILSSQANIVPVRFLMQPAEEASDEEGKSGAFRMIQDGALNDVRAIIGLHVDATIKPGQVAIAKGPVMAAADSFLIKVIGSGGHGAFPESTIDSVVIASYVVSGLQQVVSRRISAFSPAVVTIGSMHSSSAAGNVISDYVELKGTIRSFSADVRKTLMDEVEKVCQIACALGGSYSIDYEYGYPATVNHDEITQVMQDCAREIVGANNVVHCNPKLWSEDFSMYQEKIPGSFMFLGVKIESSPRKHHSPDFDIDESGLYLGAAILAKTACKLSEVLNQ